MSHFYTPLKTSENLWFSYVFRGYRNLTLDLNGLTGELSALNCRKLAFIKRKSNMVNRFGSQAIHTYTKIKLMIQTVEKLKILEMQIP